MDQVTKKIESLSVQQLLVVAAVVGLVIFLALNREAVISKIKN